MEQKRRYNLKTRFRTITFYYDMDSGEVIEKENEKDFRIVKTTKKIEHNGIKNGITTYTVRYDYGCRRNESKQTSIF